MVDSGIEGVSLRENIPLLCSIDEAQENISDIHCHCAAQL